MKMKARMQQDLAAAMRSGNKETRDTLRLILAAIKQVEIDTKETLDDDDVQQLLQQQVKLRRQSIADFERAGRAEQVAQEAAEITLIESYLPQMMPREEIEGVVQAAIAQLGVSDMSGMGRLMGAVMAQLKGRADSTLISDVARSLLSQ